MGPGIASHASLNLTKHHLLMTNLACMYNTSNSYGFRNRQAIILICHLLKHALAFHLLDSNSKPPSNLQEPIHVPADPHVNILFHFSHKHRHQGLLQSSSDKDSLEAQRLGRFEVIQV